MVWVCPPHTSMNLNSPSPASSVIRATSARAMAGSRYSSTKRIVFSLGLDPGGPQGVELFPVGLPHELEGSQRQVRLLLVDLRHGESNVDQHPVAGLQVL